MALKDLKGKKNSRIANQRFKKFRKNTTLKECSNLSTNVRLVEKSNVRAHVSTNYKELTRIQKNSKSSAQVF